ncbi:hypothetical protein HKCCE2091_15150 [Rhodobacterales bacterium HKCCE2091]|nr:hypothetical protein [Rhodobacterales bacterium HKCCE2091]
MPALLALAAIAGGIVFWILRARAASHAASELADMAGDVLGAARRFGFRRKANTHPVDAIDQESLAQGALSVAFLDLGPRQTDETRAAHLRALQSHLGLTLQEAEEILVLGPWFVNECRGPGPAVTRLGRRLMKLGGAQALDPALQVVNDVAATGPGLTDTQRDALHDLKVIFRR